MCWLGSFPGALSVAWTHVRCYVISLKMIVTYVLEQKLVRSCVRLLRRLDEIMHEERYGRNAAGSCLCLVII